MRVSLFVLAVACLAVVASAQTATTSTGTGTAKFYTDSNCNNQVASATFTYNIVSVAGVSGGSTAASCSVVTPSSGVGGNGTYIQNTTNTYVQGQYSSAGSLAGIAYPASWSITLYTNASCSNLGVGSASLTPSTTGTNLQACTKVTPILSSSAANSWYVIVSGNSAATQTISFAVLAVAFLASIATFAF